MKISENRIDPVKQEEGGWVGEKYGTPIPEMGDLCLKVRGQNNKAYRKLQRVLIEAVPRKKRVAGRLDEGEQDRITGICLRDACLDDWANMTGDDDKAVPYSKDAANLYLTDPQYGKFKDAVIWASLIVADTEASALEGDEKN